MPPNAGVSGIVYPGSIATDYFERLGVVPPETIHAWVRRCMAVPAMARSMAEALPFVDQALSERETSA